MLNIFGEKFLENPTQLILFKLPTNSMKFKISCKLKEDGGTDSCIENSIFPKFQTENTFLLWIIDFLFQIQQRPNENPREFIAFILSIT